MNYQHQFTYLTEVIPDQPDKKKQKRIPFFLGIIPDGSVFDHSLILPGTPPDYLRNLPGQLVDTPPIYRTISTPSPHLFRII